MEQSGEAIQLDKVWAAYRQSLRRFLQLRVSNEADVDDLLQDILIKTHGSLSTLRDQKSLKAWLFQVAQRSVIDFYRKRARADGQHQPDVEALWYQQSPDTLEQEMATCIGPFIESLPSESAQLLTAVELQGESQKALAEQAGVSYSTLKSRVQKSRRELRQVFERCCEFEHDRLGNVIDMKRKKPNCDC